MPVGVNSYVQAAVFTPDGRTCFPSATAVRCGGGGRPLARNCRGHRRSPANLRPEREHRGDGKTVATGSIDGTAKVWELETGRMIAITGRLKGMHARGRCPRTANCWRWAATK
jgi:hypothetical protein